MGEEGVRQGRPFPVLPTPEPPLPKKERCTRLSKRSKRPEGTGRDEAPRNGFVVPAY